MISRAHAAGLNWLAVSSWCALSSLVHTIAARTRADNERFSSDREGGTGRTLTLRRAEGDEKEHAFGIRETAGGMWGVVASMHLARENP